MARKLKTLSDSVGFFDQVIAAPSLKAALKAWGAESDLFHQGGQGKATIRTSSSRLWQDPASFPALKDPWTARIDDPQGGPAKLPKTSAIVAAV